jgi:hypothetical protein
VSGRGGLGMSGGLISWNWGKEERREGIQACRRKMSKRILTVLIWSVAEDRHEEEQMDDLMNYGEGGRRGRRREVRRLRVLKFMMMRR